MTSKIETEHSVQGKAGEWTAKHLQISTQNLEVGLIALGPQTNFIDHKVSQICTNNLEFQNIDLETKRCKIFTSLYINMLKLSEK